MLNRIGQHENLQHNINPYTLTMYGSEIGDYPHPHNLGESTWIVSRSKRQWRS